MPKPHKRRYYTTAQLEKLPVPSVSKIKMRRDNWEYINWYDGDTDTLLARYDALNSHERLALVDKASAIYRYEALRCILHVTYQVMPPLNPGRTQLYKPPQMAALVLYRWWLGVGHKAILRHLRVRQGENHLIFGTVKALPTYPRLIQFEHEVNNLWFSALQKLLSEVAPGVTATISKTRCSNLTV